jgi:hypothetical protein
MNYAMQRRDHGKQRSGQFALLVGASLAALAGVYAVGRIELHRRRLEREKHDLMRWEGEGGAAHPVEPAIDDHRLGVA